MSEELKQLKSKCNEKQAKFAENLYNGQDRADAYKNANYDVKDKETAARCGWRLLNKCENVLAYYEALKAERDKNIERTQNITRTTQIKSLNETYELAKTLKNPSAMVSALREINEMMGYHRENAPNAEREAAKRARMTKEEEKLHEAAAKLRTDQEAQERPRIAHIGREAG